MYRFRSFICVVVLGLTWIGCCHAQQSDINNPFLKIGNSNSKAVLFAPVTYIGYVEKGDKIQHSDSISNETAAILNQKIKNLREQLKADTLLPIFDTATSNTLQYELNNVVNDENFADKKKKIMLPPFLDSLLMESGRTYGMIFYQNGFLRKKRQLRQTGLEIRRRCIIDIGKLYGNLTKSLRQSVPLLAGRQKENHLLYWPGRDTRQRTNRQQTARQTVTNNHRKQKQKRVEYV